MAKPRRKVPDEDVAGMLRYGWPPEAVAKVLGCSEWKVYRIRRGLRQDETAGAMGGER